MDGHGCHGLQLHARHGGVQCHAPGASTPRLSEGRSGADAAERHIAGLRERRHGAGVAASGRVQNGARGARQLRECDAGARV